jgi:hypothetical protein
MDKRWSGRAAFVAAVLAAAGACASFRNIPSSTARGVVNRWSPPSRDAGRRLLDEYGLPDDVTPWRVTWNWHGPWKRTVVWDGKRVYRSPEDLAVMEQTVDYPLTREQAAALLAFSGALTVDLEKGELSSRADRESVDFLNLNLADEVARGRKTPAQAVAAYKRVLALTAAGKASEYTRRLLFPSPRRQNDKSHNSSK